jgi:Flp pilus assembly protein TadG
MTDITACRSVVGEKCRNFWNDDSGAGLVEFSIVALILGVIMLGIIELGLAAWQKNIVAADAREATRYAVVRGTSSGRLASAESVAEFVKTRSALDTARLRVYATWSPNKRPGSTVTVLVAHDVPRRGPFVPPHTDSASSRMVVLF